MRIALALALALALATLLAAQPLRAAEPAGKQAQGDYTQKLRPNPNYAKSAEKKYRDRVQAEARARREAALAQQAHRRFAAVVRTRRTAARVLPPIPFLYTLLGAGAGAIIGNQSGYGWEGAGIGAAAGALIDANAYKARKRTPQ